MEHDTRKRIVVPREDSTFLRLRGTLFGANCPATISFCESCVERGNQGSGTSCSSESLIGFVGFDCSAWEDDGFLQN